jgi:hypothetical protein
MGTVTLAESAKLSQDLLVSGVIEAIVTVDRFFDVLPFHEISGNALKYNREAAMGDVQLLAVGGTVTAKNPASFNEITTGLTTIIGDAEVNNLIQSTRSGQTDQKAAQIMSKAKNIGMTYRSQLINGVGTGANIEGLLALIPTSQTDINGGGGGNGAALSFANLDWIIDNVKDKNGIVDYLMMHSRTLRSYFALLRALGGAGIGEVVTLPSGQTVPGYRGVPIFRNDNIPITMTQGATNTCTAVIGGTLDDGSMTVGLAGLTAQGDAGIRITEVGESETKDETITRVKMYAGLALFSELGVAMVTGVNN